MSQKPSKVKDKDWIFARSPKRTINESIDWFERTGSQYLKSRKMYPRNIYSNDTMVPATDQDRMLLELDHEAIKKARSAPPESYHILFGKWLVFAETSHIDKVWGDLADRIECGKIPYNAKVATTRKSPLQEGSGHVICIYTPNFLFRDDVRACRIILRDLGFQERLYYKPDIFTHKAMYRVYGSKINHRYYG